MRALTAEIITALKSGELRPFLLFLMTIDGTVHAFTDCDIPLYYGAVLYQPRGFDGSPVAYGGSQIVDQITMEMDNLDNLLTPAFVGGTPQGSPVSIALALLDSNNTIIPDPITLFAGSLGAWNIDTEGVLSITITNQFAQWNQTTLSLHSASCRYQVFKGAYCQYAGVETTCDKTYTRCVALGNQINFGGFRWLPSIMDSTIWWGRVQGEAPKV